MNWKKEVFCVNLNVEDRILNFKILESSVFFMKLVDLMIESYVIFFVLFIVGIIMMFLCFY